MLATVVRTLGSKTFRVSVLQLDDIGRRYRIHVYVERPARGGHIPQDITKFLYSTVEVQSMAVKGPLLNEFVKFADLTAQADGRIEDALASLSGRVTFYND